MPHICEYDNCGRQFNIIHDLILHIEAIHIDFSAKYDPNKFRFDDAENPTEGLPMSLILKYGEDSEIADIRYKEEMGLTNPVYYYDDPVPSYKDPDTTDYLPQALPSQAQCHGPDSSPPQSLLPRRGIKTFKVKKFACPVVGCTKSYKNANGRKYHVTNYHENSGNLLKAVKVKKEFKCDYCMKEYKTLRGLQSHHQAHKQTREHMLMQSQRRMYYAEGSRGGPSQNNQYYEQECAVPNTTNGIHGIQSSGYKMAEVYYPVVPERATYEDCTSYYIDNSASSTAVQYQPTQMDQFAMQQYMQQSQSQVAPYNQQNTSNVLHKKTNEVPSETPAADTYEEFSFLQGSVSSETNSPTIEEVTTWKLKSGDFDDDDIQTPHFVERKQVGAAGGVDHGVVESAPMDMLKLIQQQQLYEHGFAMRDRSGAGGMSRKNIQNMQHYSRFAPTGTNSPEVYRDIEYRSEFDQLTYDVDRVELCE